MKTEPIKSKSTTDKVVKDIRLATLKTSADEKAFLRAFTRLRAHRFSFGGGIHGSKTSGDHV